MRACEEREGRTAGACSRAPRSLPPWRCASESSRSASAAKTRSPMKSAGETTDSTGWERTDLLHPAAKHVDEPLLLRLILVDEQLPLSDLLPRQTGSGHRRRRAPSEASRQAVLGGVARVRVGARDARDGSSGRGGRGMSVKERRRGLDGAGRTAALSQTAGQCEHAERRVGRTGGSIL